MSPIPTDQPRFMTYDGAFIVAFLLPFGVSIEEFDRTPFVGLESHPTHWIVVTHTGRGHPTIHSDAWMLRAWHKAAFPINPIPAQEKLFTQLTGQPLQRGEPPRRGDN